MDYFLALRGSLFVALLFCAVDVYSAGTCYQWMGSKNLSGMNLTWNSTAQAAADQNIAACNVSISMMQLCGATQASNANGNSTNGGWKLQSFTPGTWPVFSAVAAFKQTTAGVDYNYTFTFNLNYQANPQGCPECSASGTSRNLAFGSDPGAAGTAACGADGCLYNTVSPARKLFVAGAVGGMSYVATAESVGSSCSQSSGGNTAKGAGSSGDCQENSSGDLICNKSDQQNCGTFNGDYICPKSITSGCQTLSSGAMVCVASASSSLGSTVASPPGPDNGTAGVPATPKATVQVGSSVVNYYSSTQVTNSTTNAGSSSSGSSGSSSSGASSSASSSCSSGQTCGASGGDLCTSAPTCTGDSYSCVMIKQQWLLRCSTVSTGDAGSAFADVTDTIPTQEINVESDLAVDRLGGTVGQCPADPTFTVLSHQFTIPFSQFLCTFFAAIAGIILAGAYLYSGSLLVEAL